MHAVANMRHIDARTYETARKIFMPVDADISAEVLYKILSRD